jgi:hypothetical protein
MTGLSGPVAGKFLPESHREFLVVAHAAVDEAGVSRDMGERIGLAHMAPGPTDDDGQFAFEIELVGNAGTHQRLAVTDEGIGEAQEHARRRRHVAPGLLGMGAVVDADADDALRVRHHRQELQSGQGRSGARPAASRPMWSSAFAASACRKPGIFPPVSGGISMTPSPTTAPKLALPSAI